MNVTSSFGLEPDFAAWAPYYYNRGFGVFPCQPRSKEPHFAHLKKNSEGKAILKPFLRHRASRDVVECWVRDAPHSNPAIALGFPSCLQSQFLFVLDVEDFGLFERLLSNIDQRFGSTWSVRTARGGHIYLLARAPVESHTHYIDGLKFEVRGQGVYVLAAGAIHPDGTSYEVFTNSKIIPVVDELP
ncbi:MAG TPA: bifunctional DNA primase/polymerase [Abditibacteriaceae bacterium]|jgi:hypothetical protein